MSNLGSKQERLLDSMARGSNRMDDLTEAMREPSQAGALALMLEDGVSLRDEQLWVNGLFDYLQDENLAYEAIGFSLEDFVETPTEDRDPELLAALWSLAQLQSGLEGIVEMMQVSINDAEIMATLLSALTRREAQEAGEEGVDRDRKGRVREEDNGV